NSNGAALFASGRRAGAGDDTDTDFPVGIVTVAVAVAAVVRRSEPAYPVLLNQLSAPLQVRHEQVAFGIDLGGNMIGGPARGVAEPHAAIERRGAEPERRPLLIQCLRAPEANMMSLAGAAAHGPLESQVLAPSPKIQVAHRRLDVGPAGQHTGGNMQAGAQGG